jgi:hypothetical protein
MRGATFSIDFDYSDIDEKALRCNRYDSTGIASIFDQIPLVKFSWMKKIHEEKKSFPTHILDSMTKKLAWLNNGNRSCRIRSIQGCTEIHMSSADKHKTNRHIVRANPDYRGKGLWMDWVDVSWENPNNIEQPTILPAQVILCVNFDDAVYEDIPLLANDIFNTSIQAIMQHHPKKGIHVLLHSAEDDGNNHNEVDTSSISICKRFTMESFYQFIQIDHVLGICFVARDPPAPACLTNINKLQYEVTYVMHPTDWCHTFIPKMGEGYSAPFDEDEGALDEFNEDYNPW